MAGIDDLAKQAGDFIEQNKDKIQEVLKSEQAEDISDKVLDGIGEAVKKITPDEHDGMIDDVKGNIDKSIGNQ
ncbi:Rv0909 family putative TA system antitoxin [Agromyces sp. LHK192]|uniref:Rv0909 family putative TA system antitoxin n=1 Tax=Agromyces sp. LHK192 TaxID=2498704 RepID=UPI000FD840BC|nr:Rv0909 family putative TA system antitoxin [Agromyces sp. LHK192]